MTAPLFEPLGHYDAPAVARILFGRSAEWFWRHHEKLYRDEGFPDPISHIGRPRWRGAKLNAWEANEKFPRLAPAPRSLPPGVTDLSATLAERARTIASTGRPRVR